MPHIFTQTKHAKTYTCQSLTVLTTMQKVSQAINGEWAMHQYVLLRQSKYEQTTTTSMQKSSEFNIRNQYVAKSNLSQEIWTSAYVLLWTHKKYFTVTATIHKLSDSKIRNKMSISLGLDNKQYSYTDIQLNTKITHKKCRTKLFNTKNVHSFKHLKAINAQRWALNCNANLINNNRTTIILTNNVLMNESQSWYADISGSSLKHKTSW